MQQTSFLSIPNDHPFSLAHLPYGVFKRSEQDTEHIGVAIGDFILDLTDLEKEGYFPSTTKKVFQKNSLNAFIATGKLYQEKVREEIMSLLSTQSPLAKDTSLQGKYLIPQHDVIMCLPVEIGDYTDFYSSINHATNVGTMLRDKNNPLLPNWRNLPVGYHGRASSVVVSGTDVLRPFGQTKKDEDELPAFGPCKRLDYELELGFIIGKNSVLGKPISIEEAEDYVFGVVIVNDWSARDIQKWEYVPLGPFVSKSFATSMSAWVTPLKALAPYRSGQIEKQTPTPLHYLRNPNSKSHFDITLEVALKTPNSQEETLLCKTNANFLYWDIAQQIAHHTSTGCNLRVGDLLATGTISGPTPSSLGCLLELTENAKTPLTLANGATRTFLEDGDEVILRGYCQNQNAKIGLGEVRGKILTNSSESCPCSI